MCGIVGILKNCHGPVDAKEIVSMRNRVHYRGPDGRGIFVDNGIGLGHVRLAVIDLSPAGAQPMISNNDRYVLVYNGEVYNFRLLGEELKTKGVHLPSSGDTRTLLEYIAEFGVARTLPKLEGMFAFALWDKKESSLTLARDRHGIKPLYYCISGNSFRFASEMKAFKDIGLQPDPSTLGAALLGLGCTSGEYTIFRGIKSLRAGEILTIREDLSLEKRSFFALSDFVDEALYRELASLSKEAVIDRVAQEMEESTELRMVSDAPVGCLVSGGVDSCLVSAIAVRRQPELQLFHANVVADSERDKAEYLARKIGAELLVVNVEDEEILDHTATATYHYEIPIMYHSNAVPFFLVSRLAASKGIKVLLTGEGSDEYFIGYARFALRPFTQRYQAVLSFFQRLLHTSPPLGNLLWPRQSESLPELLRKLCFRCELDIRRSDAAQKYSFVQNPTERDLLVLGLDMVEGNLSTLLHRNDRLAMAWGLESRFPFLGYGLSRTALNLPACYRIRRTLRWCDWRHPFVVDKWCVRKVAERFCDEQMAHMPKYAFRGSIYERMQVNPTYFHNGFVADWFGLDRRAIEMLVRSAPGKWIGRLVLLDVWGQIFCLETPFNKITQRLREYCSCA